MTVVRKNRQTLSVTLESILVSKKMVTTELMAKAHRFIAECDINLGTALMYMKAVDGQKLGSLLQRECGIQWMAPGEIRISLGAKNILAPDKAKGLQVFPLGFVEESGNRVLMVAMTDPLDSFSVSKVEELSRMRVQPVFITLDDLQGLYKKYYRSGLDLFPPEDSAFDDLTAMRRMETMSRQAHSVHIASPSDSDTDKVRLQALITLLIKKGVISLDDFEKEVTRRTSR